MTRTTLPILALALASVATHAQTSGTPVETQPQARNARDTVTIRRDAVVPVLFESTIDLGNARVGDTFTARVDGGPDLPRGAKLRGRVDALKKGKSGSAGSVTLSFDEVRMPDGTRTAIRAVPVALDSDFLKRTPDGRITAKRNDRSRETKVLGGLLGGFAIGSIFKKQAEGAILGTIIGAAAAVADTDSGKEIAVKAGQRYGALFQREVTLNVGRDGIARADDPRTDDPRTDRALPNVEGRTVGADPYDAIRNRDGANRDREGNRRDDPRPDEGRTGEARTGEDRRDDRTDGAPDRASAVRDQAVRVFRGDTEIVFTDAKPFREGDTLWVPAEATARLLGLRVVDPGARPFYIDSDLAMLKVDENRDRVVVDGKIQDGLRVRRLPIGEKREAVYIPLNAFSGLVQEKITFRRVL